MPVLLAIRFAFNDGRSRSTAQGWSLRWFWQDPTLSVFHDPTLQAALEQSLTLGVLRDAHRDAARRRRSRSACSAGAGAAPARPTALMLLPLVTPELVFAVGAVPALHDRVRRSSGSARRPRSIGQVTFSISFVVVIVRGRLQTIGRDVRGGGGRPRRAAVRGRAPRARCRCSLPAIVASLLVVFALSIDDFVVSQYLASGADTTTVPMRIYSQARGAPTPALNALATIMLAVTLLALLLAYLVFRFTTRGEKGGSAIGSWRASRRASTQEERSDRGQGDIRLEGLSKRFGEVTAVDGIDLHVPVGRVLHDARPVRLRQDDDAAPDRRASSARTRAGSCSTASTCRARRRTSATSTRSSRATRCSRTRRVEDNVAFGLRYKKLGREDAQRRVQEAMDLVRLGGLGARKPAQLSGGQQQRVALARALVLEPPVLLLDEPLGALDARLRIDLQVELKRIQEQLGITFIYVTHDQDEALTMSDRVAVMRDGRIDQCATPQELYEEPATAFVANFLGAANLIPVQARAEGVRHDADARELHAAQRGRAGTPTARRWR